MHGLFSTIVSYPERGEFGDSKYRGNCSGKLIQDLLEFFRPTKFIEIFAGSGTGYEAARAMGITNSLHLDLRPEFGGWNALKDPIPCGADLIFSHPPYHDIIVYSGNLWGEPHPDDLSRCASWDEFIHKLNIVNAKAYNALRKGGRYAILIGDVKKNGICFSAIKDMVWYGDLEYHIIKAQHNVNSDNKKYNGRLIRIMHEHLLIFKKGEIWAIPVKITKTENRSLFDSKIATWRDLVQAAMEQLGGQATLSELYEMIKNTSKAKANPHWQAKVRQTLQYGDEFVPVQRGVWRLHYSNQLKTA